MGQRSQTQKNQMKSSEKPVGILKDTDTVRIKKTRIDQSGYVTTAIQCIKVNAFIEYSISIPDHYCVLLFSVVLCYGLYYCE